ncbi:glycosyltransferase involved in cell wall biosynthesis [Motilibacter rhizosphaerae]|uniref:Glycosyltransferase involved in cell wall biosynthesis n=1 Tax=Motilibacter rhizosphaerae TaxID=598652 RepID=A0A4Q7NSW4_9ACTN|nr:glycosyltransferase [Motilibacter rhizosphaerae]RZS90211.1 glycosyltransferase involved in cell wall biosynthesis [Motilibacter rhizosphaerae]
MGQRPHVLYVAWGFPPCRSGGTYRALATANALARGGFDVTVLTCEREVFERYTGVDASLEPEVDPRIRVERVPFTWPALEPDLREWSLLRAVSPPAWSRLRRTLDQRPFPEPTYGPWRPVIEQAAERIHRERPVDLVVATANPHVAFTAPLHLHDRFGVPFVADYRDAWSFDVFTGKVLHTPESREGRWEERVLAGAREVWFVNEPIRARQAAEHPEHAAKLHVVANGYDRAFVAEGVERRPDPEAGLVLGYIGTISRQVPVTELVEGWRLARESSEVLRRSTVALHGYIGHNAPLPAVQAAIAAGADAGVDYRGPVPKAEVRRAYDGFDVLLLVLGTGTYVTSGKVYEYLATGLPVVSVHDPGNAATEVVRDYPLWFPCASLEPADVAAALRAAADAALTASEEVRRQCVEFGRQFTREGQLDPRVAALLASVQQETAVAS